jgi:hypothetical protein
MAAQVGTQLDLIETTESAACRYTGTRLSEIMKKLLRFHAFVTIPRSIR